ncbi:hypothetical protein B0I35DRAFT_11384 [Stachybotrys elegans]|uniref:Uncharacterized protein n=1 Tax=Stachybotrys elegans TaxID=80388 RepID=A0A8K0WXU3_9HYPO|nr:hypothetical protein B0I35DRAFT_11384 [Stachybotrys elegans]
MLLVLAQVTCHLRGLCYGPGKLLGDLMKDLTPPLCLERGTLFPLQDMTHRFRQLWTSAPQLWCFSSSTTTCRDIVLMRSLSKEETISTPGAYIGPSWNLARLGHPFKRYALWPPSPFVSRQDKELEA